MNSPNNTANAGTSRREFMAHSTAAVVGASLASLAAGRMVHAAGDETIRVGLIGCGGRGTGAASQALSTAGPVKLVAMGDAFEFRLKESLEQLQRNDKLRPRIDVPPDRQFTGLDAFRQVIEAGVDLVILATPPGFRPQHFAAAVAAGKHVFMEKPVAVDAPGVRAVLAATAEAKKKNLAVGVGLQRRHQLPYLETIRRLQDGAIGDIHTMRAYWNGRGVWVRPRSAKRPGVVTEMQYQVDNWYYFNWLSGDHIVEQHIHNLDVCNWLKGAYPVWAQGMGGREVRKGDDYGEIFDHHAVEFVYADGARMFSYCRHIPGCWDSVSEHAQGSKGSADISAARIDVPGQAPWRYNGTKNNPYQTEHDVLFESIRSGSPINEGEYGALSSMTAIMGRMATYSGKPIEWDAAINSPQRVGPDLDAITWDTAPPSPKVPVPGLTDVGLAQRS
jgi:myo-inositol 2-dehydrogenase/D-chiro-inositol 1-dehydrogenase